MSFDETLLHQRNIKEEKANLPNNISWWRTDFSQTDAGAVYNAIISENISMGSITQVLECKLAEMLGVKHIVATTSGSVALLMSMMAINIKPGDEVIIPNRTWIATAHAVTLLGGKVILADVLSEKPILDVEKLETYITNKTKAIIPVPLNGRAVDMQGVWSVAEKYNLHVVEDAAQALFCPYQESDHYMGTKSDMGCFSFSIAKLLPTGQGGFVATNNTHYYQQLKRIRMHGVDSLMDCSFNRQGCNFRFTDMQSALALSQLQTIDSRILRLKSIYEQYQSALVAYPSIELIPVDVERGEIPIYIEVLCKEQKTVKQHLQKKGILTKEFYPSLDSALHLGEQKRDVNSNKFYTRGLTLPSGPGQSGEAISFVISQLKNIK